MTPEQLEQQSREAVIAYLQDSSVPLDLRDKMRDKWFRKISNGCFSLDTHYYRIAQSKPWYRVALLHTGRTNTADNVLHEVNFEKNVSFVKWLTDRIEYDN